MINLFSEIDESYSFFDMSETRLSFFLASFQTLRIIIFDNEGVLSTMEILSSGCAFASLFYALDWFYYFMRQINLLLLISIYTFVILTILSISLEVVSATACFNCCKFRPYSKNVGVSAKVLFQKIRKRESYERSQTTWFGRVSSIKVFDYLSYWYALKIQY